MLRAWVKFKRRGGEKMKELMRRREAVIRRMKEIEAELCKMLAILRAAPVTEGRKRKRVQGGTTERREGSDMGHAGDEI